MAPGTPGQVRRPDNAQATAPAGLTGLGNRFVELFSRKLSRRSFAVETARLIAESVRVRAVAILGYDRRRDRLALLAEHGLRPEARLVLGGGADCTWDIPMRGLRNRRISVVEAAHQNPFVPPSLVELSPAGLCIASVPLYYDYEPVGVVLLFAAGSRAFPDTHLQTLSQALRVCARGLRDTSGPALRQPPVELRNEAAEARAREAAATQAAAPVAPTAVEAVGQATAEFTAKVQSLEDELRRAHEEVERHAQKARALTASANAATRERDAMAQQLADAERARDVEATELRAQVAALEERLLAVDSERARSQRVAEARSATAAQSLQKLEGERDALTARVTAAEASGAQLQTQLTAECAERERLATQVEMLTAQLRAGAEALERTQTRYAQERATTEADRDAWKEQAVALRAQLAESAETVAGLDRELRGTVIARDSAGSQLQAVRVEVDRLTVLSEELSLRATQLEAARAAALAEANTLQRALEEERGNHQQRAEAARTEVAATRREMERVAAEAAALAAELAEHRRMLAERDERLASLRAEHDATLQNDAETRQATAALRAEVATLTAELEQAAVERQQLSDDRTHLRAALSDARQRANETDVAHAAALGQLQAEAVELRRQVEALGVERGALTDRLQRGVEEGRDLTVRLAEAQRRSGDLYELLRQRDEALDRLASEREALAAAAATSVGQLQAAQETLERTRAGALQERKALETQRDEWQEQVTTARDALAEHVERLAAVERDLRSTTVARDTAVTELQAARVELDRLAALVDEVTHAQTRLEADRAAAITEGAALRTTLDEERAARAETERGLRADLAGVRTEAERLSAALAARQEELNEQTRFVAERDAHLAALQREIEGLRQQTTDRGVLARQASDLGVKVVELEQALAAAHGEAARADRQRAALEERLEAARRREAETTAAANQERCALQEAVQRVTDERGRAEADKAALRGEIDGLRTTLTDLQATLEVTRAERLRVSDEAGDTARQLAVAEQRLQQLDTVLSERDAAVAATTAESQRLAGQLAAATEQLQIGQETSEAARLAAIEEHDALTADRDTWKQQAAAARAEIERLANQRDALQRQSAQVQGERSALATELAALRRTIDEEHAAGQRAAEGLGADLARARAEADRLTADTAMLRAELAERDVQLEGFRQREETAQRAEQAWQQEQLAVRAEVAALAGRLEEREAECEQLREGRAAIEHQLALVTATQGEAEQALAHGLDAARAQISQLEEERATLTAALAETRQRLAQTGSAHDASVAQRDAEIAKLRQQVQSLTGTRTKQTKRLEAAERTVAAHAERLEDERRRAAELAERAVQLEQALAVAEAQRASLDAELVQTRGDLSALTTQLHDAATTSQTLRDEHAALARELATVVTERDRQQQALTLQLQSAQQQVVEIEQARSRLEALLADTQRRMTDADSAQARALDQLRAETAAQRQQLERLAASRDTLAERLQETEQAQAEQAQVAAETSQRAGALAEQSVQLEQALRTAEERRTAVEARLAQAQTEIEALRQQSDDRGVLAHQASELGRKVVELEQQLVAQRGDVARAERERAAVIEELEETRRLQAEAESSAAQRDAALQATLDRLSDEQRRLEAASGTHKADADTLRAALADQRVAAETLRADHARAQAEGQDAARRLSEVHRRLEESSRLLAQRDAAVQAATAERQRLTAQIGKLTGQLRAAQETLHTVEGRSALERAAAESDRDTWKAQAAAAREEVERLSALATELNERTTQLEVSANSAAAENAALRRTLEEGRASHRQVEAALRADLIAGQAELERLSADVVAQRSALAERDEQLVALRREQEAGRGRDAEWQRTTGALRAEVAALTAQLQENGAEIRQLREAREAVERELAAVAAARDREEQAVLLARQELGQLQDERVALGDTLDAMRRQVSEMQAAYTLATEGLQREAAELRDQLAAATGERAALGERLQQAEQALVARATQAGTDRQQAATLADRCGQLEEALVAAEARRAGLDGELARARAEVEALRQQSADRGALAHEASTLASRVRQLEEQLAGQQVESARIDKQRVVLEEQVRAGREEQEQAAAAAEREQGALRDMLARVQEERRQLDAERVQRASAAEALRTQVTELRTALDELAAERERVRQEAQDVAQRLGASQEHVEELSGLLQQRNAAIQTATAEREALAAGARLAEQSAAALTSERDELRRTLADLTAQLEQERLTRVEGGTVLAREVAAQGAAKPSEPEAVPPAEVEEETVPLYQGPLAIERSAPLGAIVEGAPEPLEPPPAPPSRPHKVVIPTGELVLLDEGALRDGACAALQGAGFEVTTFAPTEAGVDEMLRRKVKCVMLNLGGGAAAWHTLRVLRERVGSRNLPILAYIMTKDAPAGFCFGRADFALWPMDPARMIERLARLRPKLKRLLALSADVDGMGRMREPLAEAKISTSIVLDGKQALEFATMVEPEAAILHLSPACPSVSRAVAGLRATEATRDLPLLLLLDKAPAPREDAFFTATTVQLVSKPAFQFTNLPEEIARVIG